MDSGRGQEQVGNDKLFSYIEHLQGNQPWGRLLDAGTGSKSLHWITDLATTRWTAVTGDTARARNLEAAFGTRMRTADRVIGGNWTDPALLYGDRYQVVLADYLLGAIDGFSPYFQDRLFTRLRPHVESRLYAVGLAPYPDVSPNPWGEIILEIARLRDACILLAGHRTYREYPVDWVIRNLESSGFVVEEVKSFPICYGPRFVKEQLATTARKLPLIGDRALAQQLEQSIAELRDRALACHGTAGSLPFGEDWVVMARPVDS